MLSRFVLLVLTILWSLSSFCVVRAEEPRAPTRSGLRRLLVIPHQQLGAAEALLAQTVQGLANRRRAQVWMRQGGMYGVVEAQLRHEGVAIEEVKSVWDLVRAFRGQIRGIVVCRLGTPSINVATSLCGPWNAIAVDESLLEHAQKEGLKVLLDARDMDEQQALDKYAALFERGYAFEQTVSKPAHLRDLAVALNAFTFAAKDSALRTRAVSAQGPGTLVFGWGPDEFKWVQDISRAGATGVPSDWNLNLSALRWLPAGRLQRPRRPQIKAEENMRYLAFVMSDGDNIQWLCGNFVDNARFWGSPLRGTFPMTWEVSPLLSKLAPRVLQHIYATATANDGFVSGAGLPGYTFLHLQPDRETLARQSAPYLRDADLPWVSTLNANDGALQQTTSLLNLPEVAGVLYKDYAPYHRRRGEIFWHNGKPCLSYKFVLWEKLMEPEAIAEAVAKMPAAPRTDEGSYALVNVHAWSYAKQGGPLEAVRRTISLLPPNTKVVTADQLMLILSNNFGSKFRTKTPVASGPAR